MMKAVQQTRRHAEFMSEAQRFLASDGEESVLSEGGDDDLPPLLRNSSRRDRRGASTCRDRGGPEPPVHRRGIDDRMDDRAWAIAFAINVVVTVLSALHFRSIAFTALIHMLKARGWDLSGSGSGSEGGRLLVAALLLVPLAHAASSSTLHALARCSKRILQISSGVFVLVGFMVVCFLWSVGAVRSAMTLAAVTALIARVLFLRWGRMDFAAANMKVAAVVVKATPQMTTWALFVVAVRAVWLAVGGIALFGATVSLQTVHAPDGTPFGAADCHSRYPQVACECNGSVVSDGLGCEYSDPSLALVCVWLASALWGSIVTVNAVNATVAQSVASWWSSPGRVEPVWESFHRVIHSSLGSICKAAVIVTFFQPMQFVVRRFAVMVRVIVCPVACVRWVVRYVKQNTVCFVSLYRVSFSEALLVVGAGGTLLTLAVVTMVMFGITGRGASFLEFSSLSDPVAAVVCSASVVTIVTTLEMVMCAFRAVFACFVQDPEAFAAKHDRWLQDGMYRSWQELQLLHSTAQEARAGDHA